MRPKIAIVYNEPTPDRYSAMGEGKAILGVLDEVEAVQQALVELGYPMVRVPLSPPLEQARGKIESLSVDLVFNLFEGFDSCPETEAAMADIFAELGLIYTGSPGSAISLALDKAKTKALMETAGIPIPKYQLLSVKTLFQFHLSYPCIVKPCAENASHGISEESVVNDASSLQRQVAKMNELFGEKALVEEFVDGRELNATVMGTDELVVLPMAEIIYSLPPGKPRILTFDAKWEPQSMYFQCSRQICPAEIDDETRQHIADAALSSFKLVGCSGYARVDFRQAADGLPKVLEVNPNPDISPGYGAARQAEVSGMTYSQFIERIIHLAYNKVKV